MKIKPSPSRIVFLIFNITFLSIAALSCVLPMINILAISFSSANIASAGTVKFWPKGFTLDSYRYIVTNTVFWRSFLVSLQRIAIALPLTLFITIISAYPMSKDSKAMPGRTFYTYFLIIPMLFSGGLIPWFLVVRGLHLNNKLIGLIVPGLVGVFNIILLMNFFRNLPKEIEEASFVDGAGPFTALFKIFIPLSKPCIATIALFIIVGNWNEWFQAIILMDSPRLYPLQSYLQSLLVQVDPKNITSADLATLKTVSNQTFRAAQIFVAAIPILVVYPWLQKYFTKGIMIGSVKG